MYEIDVCYKIIFEAMLEKPALKSIAEKINEYTGAKIIFVSGSGKILAYSHTFEQDSSESVKWSHVTFSEYEKFRQREAAGAYQIAVKPVEIPGRPDGYVVVLFSEEEFRQFFEELGSVIGKAVKHYFAEAEKELLVVQPMREALLAWSLFHGKTEGIRKTEEIWTGQYIEVLVLKKDLQGKLVSQIKAIWDSYCICEETDRVLILFFGLRAKNTEEIYRKFTEKGIRCSISEPFGKLDRCAVKYKLLNRMAMVSGLENDPVMKREKEWSVQGLYTYTTPLFKEAGLSDYRLLRLLQEDRENNTDLYYTLKVYLMNENNVTMAADSLHIHRNTLVYRLKKIRECIEDDINDNETARELLAFMMMYDISRQDEKRQK
nr:helix-turn-helix domain-containing protein [uncultured Dorea sp.]